MPTTWVQLAAAVEPVRAWLEEATGKPVKFQEAPTSAPPFTVLAIVSDPRTILTLDGGIPADVTLQLDTLGLTAMQALGLADIAGRAMTVGDPPTWDQAFVTAREAIGDGHGSKLGDTRYVWQSQYRWTLVGTS